MSTAQTIADLLLRRGASNANRTAAQGQIWGTAISNIGQQIASIPAQRRAAAQEAQAGELMGLKLQDARGELADKEKARTRQAAIERVLAQYDDVEQALQELQRRGFLSEAAAIQKHVNESKKSALDFRTQQIASKAKEAEFIGAQLSGATDPGAYTKALHTLKLAIPERDWTPYTGDLNADRALITADVAAAISVKDKADLDIKRLSEERQVATQKAAVANLEADNKRATEALTETARHNEAMEKNAAISANAALTRARRAGASTADVDGLVDTVIANPALFDQLTPTEKGKIAPKLREKGFESFGKPLPPAAVKQIAESQSALTSLRDLRTVLQQNEQYIGPIAGLQAMNPWSDARQAQANIDLVRQRVGKALEGGVLRKEDEEKYKKILATLRDEPTTAIYKIDSLIKNIEQDVTNFISQQRLSGRRVSQEQADSIKAPSATKTMTVAQVKAVQDQASKNAGKPVSYADVKKQLEAQGYVVK